MNLPDGHERKRPGVGRGKPIRWRTERRAGIARTRDLAAIAVDPPPWLRSFRVAYVDAAGAHPSAGSISANFLGAVGPLLAGAHQRIGAALRDLEQAGVTPASKDARGALLASLQENLHERLYRLIAKTMVLELAVAKRRNVLVGTGPEQRYAFFCDCLADPSFACALLEQYPVLVRRIVGMIADWEKTTLALVSRLGAARQQLIHAFFDDEDPGPLTSMEAAGDAHRGGQTVRVLRFESGQRLVYKPRSLALEKWFGDLVAWLSRIGSKPDLKEVRARDEGEFGWMEFIDAKPCQTKDGIQRFFVRQGAQLALAYILGGTDFHSENVIAHGDYPVLVDLEMLFHTPLSVHPVGGATSAGLRALETSVLGPLLLPQPMFNPNDEHWIDVSALGHSEGQLMPSPAPVWQDSGTDDMRLVYRRLPMPGGTSLPEFDGKRVPAGEHVELVVRGFCDMYTFLCGHAAALRSESGPLATAFGKPVRRVFRATEWYARLLDASQHPRFLEDAIVAEAFLRDQLRAHSQNSPGLSAIEDAEVIDLMAGDIPYFASRIGERSLIRTEGADFVFPGDGWSECCTRLHAMSEADLKRQTWLVRVAMTDLSSGSDARAGAHSKCMRDPSPDKLIATAARIGDSICDLAIMDGERATWLIPSIVDDRRLVATVAGFDLYEGLSGIALFLAHLGIVTEDRRYVRVAVAAMEEAIALYKAADREALSLGAYNGVGGLARVLALLASPLDRPRWTNDAAAILHEAVRLAMESFEIDIISGQAGLLAAALATRRTSDTALLHGLLPLAAKLKRLTTRAPRHTKAKLPIKGDAGVAHGRAGIGFALLRWTAMVYGSSCDEIAERLIRFDMKAINRTAGTPSAQAQAHGLNGNPFGWCRGLLGIALMALQAGTVRIGADARWLNKIADGIIANGTEGPLCLCHGALGQLEFLAVMADQGLLRDPQGAAAWRRQLLARIVGGDWVADSGHRLESPGLMVGLAGTGYSLLRAARSQSLPSVLTIEV